MKEISIFFIKTKSVLISFTLLLLAYSISAQTYVPSGMTLQDAVTAAPSGASTIILDDDISIEGMILIDAGKQITIRSDATRRTITYAGTINNAGTPRNYRHFNLTGVNTALILENIILDGDSIGGGIDFVTGAVATTTLTINNAVIKDCYTVQSGGAIYVNFPSPVTLNNVTFTGNRAGYNTSIETWTASPGSGGAVGVISATATATLTLQGDMVFDNNTASHNGGAIHKTTNGVFITTNLNSLKLTNNTARIGTGGAINTEVALSLIKAHIDTVTGNTAGGYGGVFSATGTAASLTLRNFYFSNNTSGYNTNTGAWVTSAGSGGVIYVSSGALTLQGNITCTGNVAGVGGGAIYKSSATGAVTLSELTSLKLINNTARTSYGGAIYTVAPLVLNGAVTDTIAGNTAYSYGGAIYTTGALTLNGICFFNNRSGYNSNTNTWNSSGDGGAVFITTPALTLQNANTFINNTAGGSGGAIFKGATGAFTVTGTAPANRLKLINNTARGGDGGAIHTSVALTLTNATTDTITGNIAGVDGGAIYTNGAALTLNGICFSNNKAGYNSNTDTWQSTGDGGAIAATNAVTLQNAVTFINNTASGNGGAIYKDATGAFTITTTAAAPLLIDGNTTINGDGGGIYTVGTLNFPATAFFNITNNTAGRNGGGIYVVTNGTYSNLRILPPATAAIFSGNTASRWTTTIADRDIPANNEVFNNRPPFTFSNDGSGTPSPLEFGLNNYDVNYNATYLVTFVPNNGSPSFTQWVRSETAIDAWLDSRILSPTNPGRGFYGWYDNPGLTGTPWDLSTLITQTTTLYARWDLEFNHVEVNCEHTHTIDVLAWNDMFVCDLSDITVTIIEGSKVGATVTIDANRNMVYTPAANFTGQDTLTYRVSCAGTSEEYERYLYIMVTACPENIGDADCFTNPPAMNLGMRLRYSSPEGDKLARGASATVGDIDGCGEPEILILNDISADANHKHNAIYVYGVNPATDVLYRKYTINITPNTDVTPAVSSTIAIAKTDGDPYSSIFYASVHEGKLYKYVFNGASWSAAWNVTYATNPHYYLVYPSVADIMGNGRTQISILDKIIDTKTGAILVDAGFIPAAGRSLVYSFGCFGHQHSNLSYASSMVVTDIDRDGIKEVIGGDCVYGVNLVDFDNPDPSNTFFLKTQASNAVHSEVGDGGTALADFDNCGLPEVAVSGPIANNYDSGNGTLYIYNPRTGAVIHTSTINNIPRNTVHSLSRPSIGNFGGGIPDIVIAGYNALRVYRYDRTAGTLVQRSGFAINGTAPPATVFNFTHDMKDRIVSHDNNGQLRIIDGSGTTAVVNASMYVPNSNYDRYPVVVDMNNDGAAEIITTKWENNSSQLQVFASSLRPWAPARSVWNQNSYYALNVNDDLTIPQHPMSTGTVFPGTDGNLGTADDVRPFNGFFLQQTTLNELGNKLWRTPEIVWDMPALTATIDGDSVVFEGCIKNIGETPLVAPVYVSFYRNKTANFGDANFAENFILTDTLHQMVEPGSTYCFSITLHNVGHYAPMDSIWISMNDLNGVYPNQMQCGVVDGRRGFPISLKKTNDEHLEVLTCWEDVTIDVLANNNVTSCSRGEVTLTVLSPTIAGNTAELTGDNIRFTYAYGFKGRDTVNYVILCKDTMYGGRVLISVVACPDNMEGTAECTGTPDFTNWNIKLQLTDTTKVSTRSVPLVGDIDADGKTEIIVPGNISGDYASRLRIFEMNNKLLPAEQFRWQQELVLQQDLTIPYINVLSNPYVIANVDGGPYAAIFVATSHTNNAANDQRRLIKYVTTDGTTYARPAAAGWPTAASTPQYSTAANAAYESPQPMITNFNSGDIPHVVVYDRVYNARNGVLLVNGNLLGVAGNGFGIGGHLLGTTPTSMMAVADIDGDGAPEVIGGNSVYKVNIINNTAATGNSFTKVQQADARADVRDGATAVADMTGDGFLDVVVTTAPDGIGNATLYIWNPRTGEILNNNAIEIAGNISIPMIGDIDGDGIPEICVNSVNILRAYEYNAFTRQLTEKWQKPVNEPSGTTAVTLFDFNQDGQNDLVYRNAEHLMIIDGTDGASRTSIPCGSATGNEYPVVADVNGDGAAEIIVTGDNTNAVEGQVMVFSSQTAKDKWAPTRRVWNQYAYNVVNIHNNLTVPLNQMNPARFFPNTAQPYNGYLMQQTLLDDNMAPLWILPNIAWTVNPTLSIAENAAIINGCIQNTGNAGLPAPIYVTFYQDDPTNTANVLAVDSLRTYLLPGESYCFFDLVLRDINTYPISGSFWISMNDSAGVYPHWQQCETDGYRELTFPTEDITIEIPLCWDSMVVDIRPHISMLACELSENITVGTSSLGATVNTTDSTFVYYWGTIGDDELTYSVDCNGIRMQGKIFITPILCPVNEDDIVVQSVTACFGDVITLEASSPTTEDPVFYWYASQTATRPMWIGNTYTTGLLTEDIEYYVGASGAGYSETLPGYRKAVKVTVFARPKVTPKRDCIILGN